MSIQNPNEEPDGPMPTCFSPETYRAEVARRKAAERERDELALQAERLVGELEQTRANLAEMARQLAAAEGLAEDRDAEHLRATRSLEAAGIVVDDIEVGVDRLRAHLSRAEAERAALVDALRVELQLADNEGANRILTALSDARASAGTAAAQPVRHVPHCRASKVPGGSCSAGCVVAAAHPVGAPSAAAQPVVRGPEVEPSVVEGWEYDEDDEVWRGPLNEQGCSDIVSVSRHVATNTWWVEVDEGDGVRLPEALLRALLRDIDDGRALYDARSSSSGTPAAPPVRDETRSFAWAQHPDSREWWLVEMENGAPRRAFRPPRGEPLRSEVPGETMERAWRDSFCRWSLANVPAGYAPPPQPTPARQELASRWEALQEDNRALRVALDEARAVPTPDAALREAAVRMMEVWDDADELSSHECLTRAEALRAALAGTPPGKAPPDVPSHGQLVRESLGNPARCVYVCGEGWVTRKRVLELADGIRSGDPYPWREGDEHGRLGPPGKAPTDAERLYAALDSMSREGISELLTPPCGHWTMAHGHGWGWLASGKAPDGTAPERAREAELLAALKPAVTMLDWALRTLQKAPIEVAFASAYAENCRKAIARGRAVIDATRPPDGMPGEPTEEAQDKIERQCDEALAASRNPVQADYRKTKWSSAAPPTVPAEPRDGEEPVTLADLLADLECMLREASAAFANGYDYDYESEIRKTIHRFSPDSTDAAAPPAPPRAPVDADSIPRTSGNGCVCWECGLGVAIDEDGCCVHCGGQAGAITRLHELADEARRFTEGAPVDEAAVRADERARTERDIAAVLRVARVHGIAALVDQSDYPRTSPPTPEGADR